MKKHATHFSARILSLAGLVLLALASSFAQRIERTPTTWRPVHYDIDIAFADQLTEFKSARAQITVEVLAASLTKIDFDFGDMPIDSVTVGGQTARTERTAETLNVFLPQPAARGQKLDVTITYHGHPKDGMVFAKDRDGNPSATGDNWPNRVHYWIPTLDHPSAKATVSFTISAPQRYEVIANGKFMTLTGNAATSHWKFDEGKAIPPYCMIMAVNQGAIVTDTTERTITNMLYNVPQRDREYATKGFSSAPASLAFFNQTVAPYPYEKLALIIGATRFGGMENSSAIVFTSTLFDLRANEKMSTHFGIPSRIESVVAHEIAHQWFGDSVTEATWADLWLSEGFATYFAGLFIQKYDGEESFRTYMNDAAQRYFTYEKQRNAPIHDTQTQDLMKLLNENNYEKGAWVLHMLRMRLGDDAFFRGLRAYYLDHREGNATTEDLRAALERTSKTNLQQFFTRWIYGSGHPVYQWSSQAAEQKNGTNLVTIVIKQTQAGLPFADPIPVTITSEGKTTRVTLQPKGRIATAQVRVGKVPLDIKIDPEDSILKELVSGQMVK
jgi:aminopeptidase N